jgi:hypothetical protein
MVKNQANVRLVVKLFAASGKSCPKGVRAIFRRSKSAKNT